MEMYLHVSAKRLGGLFQYGNNRLGISAQRGLSTLLRSKRYDIKVLYRKYIEVDSAIEIELSIVNLSYRKSKGNCVYTHIIAYLSHYYC